ncbi:hypothetical protein [Lactococcus allomyrinae]|uniref:Uncharacterized protein n=1 Tax=Lactococcus allomyrinae TaxID=2419773 RepID=A0A387BDV6_9LACT|nr:hypothetical protein [Lactococcus allomyrinae]AYG02053.1 hypothetical protein D7I46_13015 [Lactococcus allomyrinae]
MVIFLMAFFVLGIGAILLISLSVFTVLLHIGMFLGCWLLVGIGHIYWGIRGCIESQKYKGETND